MEKKYLYFQPEYVGKFKCDGSKCDARCCKNWRIFIDKKTYEKYPRKVAEHLKFHSERGEYEMKMDERNFCPMLTENNLCGLQLKYGEDFLSNVCSAYPRYTYDFGKFFERSLTLTCPVAAEMILFQEEPMSFEFVEVSEKIHSNGGKITISSIQHGKDFGELMLEIQIAMISILQERTLSIDQRLIVLGFFLDRFAELHSKKIYTEEEAVGLIFDLKKLIATYESKSFLREQVPRMFRIINFDAKKFIRLMLELFEDFYGGEQSNLTNDGRKFIKTVAETLEIKPDENETVPLSKIVAKYERLADARKKFQEKYLTFFENFLVNDLFMHVYPWQFEQSISKNYAVFVTSYKVFELIMFSATCEDSSSKNDLLKLVDWFTTQCNHRKDIHKKIIDHFDNENDIFLVMESLLGR